MKTQIINLYEDLMQVIRSGSSNENDVQKEYEFFYKKLIEECKVNEDVFEIYRLLKLLETDLQIQMKDSSMNENKYISHLIRAIQTELDICNYRIVHLGEKPTATGSEGKPPKRLQWSESKVALVELIYSLKKCINKGNATIKDIAGCMQYIFQIDLGNYYDLLDNINLRKNEQAKFLHSLIDNLYEELDKVNNK